MIRDFLKDNILLADGAIGTYFTKFIDNENYRVELANINDPDIILKIHSEYIKSGAKLIRTNTFSANTKSLNISTAKLKEVIKHGCLLVTEAKANNDIFIAANIGPIPETSDEGLLYSRKELLDEYKFIIDCFIECGILIFNFETFSNLEYLPEIINYIKSLKELTFIAVQFSVMKSGYTRSGIYIDDIVSESNILDIDVLGFNCGSGPAHLVANIKKLKKLNNILSSYPNSGYPEIINNRTVFNNNPKYFADILAESIKYGVKILGGCCGTTPDHISMLNNILNGKNEPSIISNYAKKENSSITIKKPEKDFIIAVELDPPFKPDLTKILKSAADLKNIGVDFITLADSPSGRMRLNPITVASRIKRDINIDVMPHICCRDRNLIALESDILAAHTEGIRHLLLVTGDPVPFEKRDDVKKVFNCNSVTLMKRVKLINNTFLDKSPFLIAGALNLSVNKLENEIIKMDKKNEAGATLFLTQPIYDDRTIEYLLNMKNRDDTKILAGILPIVTYKNAQFLNNEFPGISIPNNIIFRFNPDMDRDTAEKMGIDIAVETVNKLKSRVDGFYFITPFLRTNMIKEIIKRTNIK
ncbi:MAG: bifunctional homocysteine S-methyltransferase/methylenetetrahydrofolate reductase [Spirochaetaceae bacterium]